MVVLENGSFFRKVSLWTRHVPFTQAFIRTLLITTWFNLKDEDLVVAEVFITFEFR